MKGKILGIVLAAAMTATAFALAVGGTAAAEVSGPVLAGRWRLDENTVDISGNGNNGTLTGPPPLETFVSGMPGYGQALTAAVRHYSMRVPDSSSLDATSALTLEAWVNFSSLANRSVVVGKVATPGSASGEQDSYYLQVIGGIVSLVVRTGTGPSDGMYVGGATALELNRWHHLAGTYEYRAEGASVARVFVDGSVDGMASGAAGPVLVGTAPLMVGRLDGFIDEVRVWRSALTAGRLDDMLPPAVTITTPASGSAYLLNQSVTANWSVADGTGIGPGTGLTGIDPVTVTATTGNGSQIDTASVGAKNFTLSATDYAMNTTSRTVRYYVRYGFGGFMPPLVARTEYKLGATIPVKFQLTDAQGNYVTDAPPTISLQKLVSGSPSGEVLDESSGNANDDNQFRYDSTSDQYVFNLSTRGATAGTWRISVSLADGTTQTIDVSLK